MASDLQQTGTGAELVIEHPEFVFTKDELHKIRVCVEGSLAVKAERYTLLPHPSQIEQNSQEQRARYNEYIANAEYRNDASATKRQLLGKMTTSNATIELPERISYLNENVDGDGLNIFDAIEYSAGEALEMKYHFLVADYAGLSDVAIENVSIADLEELNPRAQIKQYSRDTLVNWNFRRINGVMQLSYAEFRETGSEFDPSTGVHIEVYSYLILALDENGEYYQQKKVYGSGNAFPQESQPARESIGERNYVEVGGQRLNFLPVAIVSDEALTPGCLPRDMSFLHEIIEISLQRYRMSARYKETQTANIPTKFTRGWQPSDMELFSDINQRDYMVTGGYGINNLPNNVEVGVVSASSDMTDFQWDFERYNTEIAKLGGTNESGDRGNLTATEADIIANNINALLNSLATSLENGWARAIFYCGMFEGIFAPDSLEQSVEQIELELPRDFAKSRLSVEEVRTYIEMWMGRIISRETLLKQVKNGGWLEEELDDLINMVMESGDTGELPLVTDGDGE